MPRPRWKRLIWLSLLAGTAITLMLVVFGPLAGRASGLDAWLSWKTIIEETGERSRLCQVNGEVRPLKEIWMAWLSPLGGSTASVPARATSFARSFPTWVSDGSDLPSMNGEVRVVTTFASGWPFRAASSVACAEGTTLPSGSMQKIFIRLPGKFLREIHLVDAWMGSSYERVVIPLRPIMAGLIGDIAFWSVVAFGVFTGTGLFRRSRRRRRGLCESCGYDLRGSPGGACPECGEVPRRALINGTSEVRQTP